MKLYTILALLMVLFVNLESPILAMNNPWQEEDNEPWEDFCQKEVIKNQVADTVQKHQGEPDKVRVLALEFDMEKYNPSNEGNFETLKEAIGKATISLDGKLEDGSKKIGLLFFYLNEPMNLDAALLYFETIEGITSLKDAREYTVPTNDEKSYGETYKQLLAKNDQFLSTELLESVEKDQAEIIASLGKPIQSKTVIPDSVLPGNNNHRKDLSDLSDSDEDWDTEFGF